MNSILKKYNIAILIINLIGSIVSAIVLWVEEFIGFGFLALLGGIIYAVFIFVLIGTLVETGENVEALEYKISSLETAIKKDAHPNPTPSSEGRMNLFADQSSSGRPPRQVAPTQWKCKFCNRINYSYTGTCACGHTKKESEAKA